MQQLTIPTYSLPEGCPPLPNKVYRTLLMDPPWFYRLRVGDSTHRNRIPYPPMKTEDIMSLPISHLCDRGGAVLWLWTTNNHMPDAISCMNAWGFELKTILTWEKVTKAGTPHIKTGHWLRNCTEHCLLCTRGKVTCFKQAGTLFNEGTILRARTPPEHSRKPSEIFPIVEKLSLTPRLEMFAREWRPGWDCWGNETTKFNLNQG